MDRMVRRVRTTCRSAEAIVAVCRAWRAALKAAAGGRMLPDSEPGLLLAANLVEWANAALMARQLAHIVAGVEVEVRLSSPRPDEHGSFVGAQVPTKLTLWAAGLNSQHFAASFELAANGRPEAAVIEWTGYSRDLFDEDGAISTELVGDLAVAGEEWEHDDEPAGDVYVPSGRY